MDPANNSWPSGRSCAVSVSIDVLGDALVARGNGPDRPLKHRSSARYGLYEGAARLLDVLTARGLPADWYFTAAAAADRPHLAERVSSVGHGIGFHCLPMESRDDRARHRLARDLAGGRALLHAITGQPVEGFRMTSSDWHPGVPEHAVDAGFRWSSSLVVDDVPFWLGTSGLLEIPVRHEWDLAQYLAFNLQPAFPPGQGRIASSRTVFGNLRAEIAGAARWGTSVVLRLPADVAGTPARAAAIGDLLDWALAQNAWMCSHRDLLDRCHAGPPDPQPHAYDRFLAWRAEVA